MADQQFNPAADPAYVALINGLNLSQSTAEQNTRQTEDEQRQALAQQLPQIADSHTQSRIGINGSMEARGVLFSGETGQKLALDRQAEAYQVGNAQQGTASAVANLERQLATQRAGIENQRQGGYADSYNRWYADQQQAAAQAEQQRQAAAQQAAYYSALQGQQAQQNAALQALYQTQQAPAAAPAPQPQTLAAGVTQQQAAAQPTGYDSRGRPVYDTPQQGAPGPKARIS